MAKIEEKVTYKNNICEFKKSIGNLSFYSYSKGDEDESLLIVDKDKNVLANITACHGDGAYGMYWDGFKIDKE